MDEVIPGLLEQIAQVRAAEQPQKKSCTCDQHKTNQKGSSHDKMGRNYRNWCNTYDKSKIHCYHCEGWNI